MKKFRHLLLLSLLGIQFAPSLWAQEEAPVSKKKQQQQEDYKKGRALFPAKPLNNPSLGIFIGSAHILGDVRTNVLDLGLHKTKGDKVPFSSDMFPGATVGLNFQKALGHIVSLRGQVARGWVAGQGYLTSDGSSNPYWRDFYVNKPVVYNYRMDNIEVLAQAVFHLNNINFYNQSPKWGYYVGVGGGLMGYRTMINATKDNLGETVKKSNAFDYESPIAMKSSYDGENLNFTFKNPQVSGGKGLDWISNSLGWVNDDWKIALGKLYDNGKYGKVNLFQNALFGKKYYETEVSKDKTFGYITNKNGKGGRQVKPIVALSYGVKYRISERLDLGLEQTVRSTFDDNLDGVSRHNRISVMDGALGQKTASADAYVTTNLSLNVHLGKKATPLWFSNPLVDSYKRLSEIQKVKSSLEDADNDGVADVFDKDANTPDGVRVDGSGRPLDSDGDGYPDNVDKERFSPAGADVDADGVARDSDRDGVPDVRDQEKNSAAGALVDVNGKTIPKAPTCNECTADLKKQIDDLNKAVTELKNRKPEVVEKVVEKVVTVPGTSSPCTLPSIMFDAGSAVVKQSYYAQAFQVAKYLTDNPSATVAVVAHPESSSAAAASLARKRAQAAINFLSGNFGINPQRLTIEMGGISAGFGVSTKNPKNDALNSMNRRVDFECR